jgi:hypothetical protein
MASILRQISPSLVTLLYRNIKTVASRQTCDDTLPKGKVWRILFEKKGILARNLRQFRPQEKKD